MNGRLRNNLFLNDGEDPDYSPQNSEDSPPAAVVSTSDSPKRSRRAVQKRVVSVPITDVEGSRLKGETPPPSDSWAWRKYGQKPIKGSPYPRGYYRCSSSKGCPAKKQVEKSRVDPTMLVVTYSFEHNHPWPTSRNNSTNRSIDSSSSHSNNTISNDNITDDSVDNSATPTEVPFISTPTLSSSEDEIPVFENQFANIAQESLVSTYQFKWSPDLDSKSPTTFESPILGGGHSRGGSGAVVFPMGEEDESLFADLGELPECSVVFQRGVLEERRHCSIAPWFGTTG